MGMTPTVNEYLVAFIDILGFGKRALSISGNADLKELYNDIKHIHDVFDKVPETPGKESETEISRRKVLALSDALVVATALDSPLSETMGVFDNLCDAVYIVGINQAICAANGVFLRGGLSKGQFFFEDDILVSAAMTQAYEIETKVANWPVICVDEATYAWFADHVGGDCYSEDNQPGDYLFMEYQPKQGVTRYCVDYIRIGINAAYGEFTASDRKEYLKYSVEKREEVRERIANRHARDFLMHHKQAILNQRESGGGEEPKVAAKYEWLSDYHNRVAGELFPDDPECKL